MYYITGNSPEKDTTLDMICYKTMEKLRAGVIGHVEGKYGGLRGGTNNKKIVKIYIQRHLIPESFFLPHTARPLLPLCFFLHIQIRSHYTKEIEPVSTGTGKPQAT